MSEHHFIDDRGFGNDRGYGVVVGTVDVRTMHTQSGESGDHLVFFVQTASNVQYQVDINTQSKFGSDIELFSTLETDDIDLPALGESSNAALSYAKLKLTDRQFAAIDADTVAQELQLSLDQCERVAVYGHLYDDGGPSGKGIHETHYVQGSDNQDGAVAVYHRDDAGSLTRTWFFFKFAEDHIG